MVDCCTRRMPPCSSLTPPGSLQQTRVKRFRGGLVFKAHRLCVSLNSRLGSKEEQERGRARQGHRSFSMFLTPNPESHTPNPQPLTQHPKP